MPRINIYVDDELHAQMMRTERLHRVNWSSVAQQAFECEIAGATAYARSMHVRESLIAQCNVWLRGLQKGVRKSA